MLKARDVMIKDVISVKRDTPIFDAVKLIADKDITGLPVVREDNTLIGILSEKDVLSLFYAYEEGEDKTVDDFMTQPAVHFDEEESLEEVCNCLMDNFFRRVPVTSGGKLVGIVTRKDIIQYVLKLRSKNAATG